MEKCLHINLVECFSAQYGSENPIYVNCSHSGVKRLPCINRLSCRRRTPKVGTAELGCLAPER
ncbi:hypothetical protein J6590_064506 [Homalodisca vitripennis]|nr:hypothetical protein J6590_064506 [Homalodisca vitripennis]